MFRTFLEKTLRLSLYGGFKNRFLELFLEILKTYFSCEYNIFFCLKVVYNSIKNSKYFVLKKSHLLDNFNCF